MLKESFFYRRETYDEIPEFKATNEKYDLSLMELPYQTNLHLEKENEKIKLSDINRYPNIDCNIIKNKLCEHHEIDYDNNILLGNGLLEIIQTILLSFSTDKTTIIIPSPSFFMFTRLSKICRTNVYKIPLDINLNIDVLKFIDAAKKNPNPIIIIDNPNNPTGVLFKTEDLKIIASHCKCPIIIDEAYINYSKNNSTSLELITNFDNVIILRSFSKIGFAGLRFGYLISNRDMVSYINKFSLQYSLSDIKLKLALEIIDKNKINKEHIKNIKKYRDEIINKLSNVENVFVSNSQANFVFFRGDKNNIAKFNHELIKHRIKVSIFPHNYSEITNNSIRFSLGNKKINNIIYSLILKSF
ncbi:pyridoxal phosphate-dependent aminotransferase [Xenorhabdus eapokensis]|uniref:Aminotransferase n=1 Tax=Xenorhabdus eapokensis TaxID=1873482 RepID=A0A1Q5TX67_9GAMM|nr:histidinol-phosphate transaminase [Xenorhabdus eapokensis]OKP04811.1 aminotransferase [Xenorhabdus eapokensis]OKP05246.1 aminotransferase [Xenorhabdus eapokensis]